MRDARIIECGKTRKEESKQTRDAKQFLNLHQRLGQRIIEILLEIKIDEELFFLLPIKVEYKKTTTGDVFINGNTNLIGEDNLKQHYKRLRKYIKKGPYKKTAVKMINEISEIYDVRFKYQARIPDEIDVWHYGHEIQLKEGEKWVF